ncbi:MAG: amidohydrolase family protein [Rhizobiaceae bacterium]|nr:amidohydrolase family protein [Rhizobiaceae bacterium]
MPTSKTAESGLNAATSLHALRPEWLALRQEPIIAPELPIIDGHHHLWDHPGSRYLVPDMIEDVRSGHNVVATVYVQAGTGLRTSGPEELRQVGETEFAVAAAEKAAQTGYGGLNAAIVGPISLMLGAAAKPVLEAHVQAGRGRFRGVRDLTHWDEDPAIHKVHTRTGMLATPHAAEVAALLSQMGLSLDVFCYHTQLPEVVALARLFPDLRIVINHVGTPLAIGRFAGKREAVFAEWRAQAARLGEHSNVSLKFGGLGMRFSGSGFDRFVVPPSSDDLTAAWRPWFDAAIGTFGPRRIMFESNFPMDKASFSYPVLWNAYKKLAAGLSPDERARLLSGTAAEVYGIGLPATH